MAKPPYLNKIRRRLWLAPITSKGKAMRKTLGVCLLVLLLTGPVVAGEIPNGSPAPPPSQPATSTEETTADGIIQNGAPDSLTQIALELLSFLPSLF